MRGIKDKKVKLLIIYSVVTLMIFIIGLKYIMNIFEQENKQMIQDVGYEINLDDSYSKAQGIIPDIGYGYQYDKNLTNNFYIAIIIFFLFIIISNFILLVLLKKIDFKNRMEIINNIEGIEDNEETLNADPIMAQVYKELKDRFDSHIEDYKRLNSYLSHEQKNAIAILRTSLELSESKELISTLDKVSDSVDDILAISDTKNKEEMYEVDIVLICAEVCDHYATVYNNLFFNFDEDANTSIYGKEKWIYRAISNLIDNAIKYGEGRDIIVNVKNEKGSVIIIVQDKGIGMDKASMKKIFYDRYRINELNKDGYGIGLSLVKHVCNLCDGLAWVESEENKGSTFYLVFKEYK